MLPGHEVGMLKGQLLLMRVLLLLVVVVVVLLLLQRLLLLRLHGRLRQLARQEHIVQLHDAVLHNGQLPKYALQLPVHSPLEVTQLAPQLRHGRHLAGGALPGVRIHGLLRLAALPQVWLRGRQKRSSSTG